MKKNNSFSLGGFVCLVVLLYVICCLLLHGNILPFSVSTVQLSMKHWLKHWDFLVVGLMPVYIAIVFFGTLIGGIFFSSVLQRWLSRFYRKTNNG